MYYVNLGNLGYCAPNSSDPTSCPAQAGWDLVNTGPFENLPVPPTNGGLEADFWTDTASGLDAFLFFFDSGGSQGTNPKSDNTVLAWAVRPGDVVPEPTSILLVCLPVIGLTTSEWRRRRRLKGR